MKSHRYTRRSSLAPELVEIPGSTVQAAPAPAFQWEDALVGALAAAGMILFVGGAAVIVRRHREHAVAVS
jgi:hypothetical protein